jgi:hypothetical protein
MNDLLFTPVFWRPARGIGRGFSGSRSGKRVLLRRPLRTVAVAFVVSLIQPRKKRATRRHRDWGLPSIGEVSNLRALFRVETTHVL